MGKLAKARPAFADVMDAQSSDYPRCYHCQSNADIETQYERYTERELLELQA